MSTIINATTTNGVVIQPDNSGSLQLATNSGTTAVTIDTSQNVGIGTSSPSYKLDTVSSTNAIAKFTYSTVSSVMYNSTGSGNAYWGDTSVQNAFAINSGSNYVTAWTNNAERMRIDTNGQNTMTTTIGYAQLRNVTGTTVAASGTVDFPNMSGIIIVNNWNQGSVVIFSCGGGSVTTVNTNGLYGGSVAYRSAVGGYRWTSNHPSSADYSFTVIATRITA